MIYFCEERSPSSGRHPKNALQSKFCVSAIVTDTRGLVTGTVLFDVDEEAERVNGNVTAACRENFINGGCRTVPLVYFDACSNARPADAFKLFAVGARLMQSYSFLEIRPVLNDKVLHLYRRSGASIPMIDAAIDVVDKDYTGILQIQCAQYNHVLRFAGINAFEMELFVANSNIAV